MIKEKCFTEEWLESFKNQAEHKKIDKIILEKMIYALHLLEQLEVNNLNFVFKGRHSSVAKLCRRVWAVNFFLVVILLRDSLIIHCMALLVIGC